MKFDHKVKHDGILYEAGTDVPVKTNKSEITEDTSTAEEPVVEEKKSAKK